MTRFNRIRDEKERIKGNLAIGITFASMQIAMISATTAILDSSNGTGNLTTAAEPSHKHSFNGIALLQPNNQLIAPPLNSREVYTYTYQSINHYLILLGYALILSVGASFADADGAPCFRHLCLQSFR
jgi:hypothetical protein